MTAHYVKGRAFEYAVRKQFRSAGHFVVRSAGSKGVADLVVLRQNGKLGASEVALVQCKAGTGISTAESAELAEVAKRTVSHAVAVIKEQGRAVYYPLHSTGRPVYARGLSFKLYLEYLAWRRS